MAVFTPSRKASPIHRIDKFRGLNVGVDATQIAYNESPNLQNVFIDDAGIPTKRSGYKKVFPVSLGAGKVNALYNYRKSDGTLVRLIHHGTKLYTWNDSGAQPIEIYALMNNAKSSAFTMNGIGYILDGANYLQYNGVTVSVVDPYIPATRISAAPDGTGGVANEDHNLIGAGFENWFTGNATTVYTLTQKVLDATAVVASIDFGVTYNKVEGTDFTVNRTTGVVTFTGAPPSTTDANNVRIRAFKTVAGNANKIKQAKGHFLFGGSNDTRVFFWNGHTLYRSGVYRPNYVPENGFQQIGTESEDIMGMALQYDTAVIYKTYSIWNMQFNDNGTTITFPVRPLNDSVGAQAADSIKVINNNAVAVTDTGVYELVGGQVRDERNVSLQSKRIDKLLLRESNLENAVSVDTGHMYMIAINNNVYVWDYDQPQQDKTQKGEWYKWTNIPASCFYTEGTSLYMGDNAIGMVYRFTNSNDLDQYADNGMAIDAYWRSKIEYLGTPERLKTVKNVWVTIQPYSKTSAEIYYYDETNIAQLLGTTGLSLFDYATFSYISFSYVTSSIPQTTQYKAKVKKVNTFQIEIRNNKLNERLGILSTEWEYDYKTKVK
jgi:hypothetical protein